MAIGDAFLSDIDSQFLSGGTGLVPSQGKVSVADALRTLLGAVHLQVATTSVLTATKAKNRKDGQLAVVLADHSVWMWWAADASSASATVIVPTDVGVGAGRWKQKVA